MRMSMDPACTAPGLNGSYPQDEIPSIPQQSVHPTLSPNPRGSNLRPGQTEGERYASEVDNLVDFRAKRNFRTVRPR